MDSAHRATSRKFLLALPDPLRADLERAAFVHRRSLTAEVVIRLERSVSGELPAVKKARDPARAEERNPFSLTETEEAMLEAFRAMAPEKQLALLSLFK